MELKSVLKKLLLPALLAVFLLKTEVNCKGDLSGECKKVHKDEECPHGYEEIYKEDITEDSSDYYYDSEELGITRYCCTKHSGKAQKEKKKAVGCRVSICQNFNSKKAKNDEICKSFAKRWVKGKELHYEEAIKDECLVNGDKNTVGTNALCCPKNSKEGMLTLLLGAEMHQFPHYAMLRINKGHSTAICGGTVYNERYIVTASHCMLADGVMHQTEGSKVFLDVRIANTNNPHTYDVKEFIPHPNSTRWDPDATMLYNDVGLIKLKKKIKFGPHIKALPLAKPDFDPFKYGDETVLVGVGDTDTTLRSNLLQRTRTYLRHDKENIDDYDLWGNTFSMEQAPGVLFVGGFQDGTNGTRSGPGDSGGPAICRDENGLAVLCGLDSSGPNLANCEKKLNRYACMPLSYMDVSHYYDWFISIAGDQKKADVLKQPLFGAPVPDGKYEHQVRITSSGGPSCGGTLIEKDTVLTAAHCVADDSGNKKSGLKVFSGIRDLNSDKGYQIDVQSIKVLDGFQLGNQGSRNRRIARLDIKPTPLYPYYQNDLAIVKLASKVDISSSKLPKIGRAPEDDGDFGEIVWTTEISLPTNTSRSGKLQQREFQILEHKTCQRRMNWASYVDAAITVDDNILCGEEMYNGAAQCDRELGGALICNGDDGSDVLCGIQVFRFCQLALPSAFLDIYQYKDWVEKNKS